MANYANEPQVPSRQAIQQMKTNFNDPQCIRNEIKESLSNYANYPRIYLKRTKLKRVSCTSYFLSPIIQ